MADRWWFQIVGETGTKRGASTHAGGAITHAVPYIEAGYGVRLWRSGGHGDAALGRLVRHPTEPDRVAYVDHGGIGLEVVTNVLANVRITPPTKETPA